MITLIIGQNAIGKSAYLRDKIKKSSTNSILTNMIPSDYLKNVEYNKERIQQLEDILDTDNIIRNQDLLGIETDEVTIGQYFTSILTLICKNGSMLYLDTPELGLSYKEIGFLVWFLCRVEDTFTEIEIVTHSEILLGISNKKVRTVEYDENRKEFKLVDLKDDVYNMID